MSDKVPDGWKKYKLEEVAKIVGGGTPRTDIDEYWNGDIPWITPKDLSNFNGRYISKGERSITKKGLINSSAKLLPPGTILLTSRAPVGYLAIAKNEITTNQGFRSLIPSDNVDNLFLFYSLKNNIKYLKFKATGTTFEELNGSVLGSLVFLFPPIAEQRAIASVLSSLDDKIDLLHRENKTLTKILNTCYNLYFTAKHTKKKRTVPLSDIAEIITGKPAPIEEYNKKEGKTVKIASVRDFDYSKIYITDTKEHITQEAVDKMHYTIAPANTVLFVYEISPGKVALTDCPMVTKTAIAQLRIKDNAYITPEYLYLYLKHFNYNRFIKTYTIVNSINKSKIGDIPIVIPDKETIDKFTEQVVPLFTKVKTNNYTIQTLERLRNALLPALISGKIRVV